ncbi:MAG: VWA domain-containing protein, partial [Candidatus Heimdallarchaeota archaeon]|nr:VWA domain-containing protein [Candidatus Heimdallarchaeota archaeon]
TVVAFETDVSTLWDEPHIASETFKQEAKDWVNSLEAGGSTNFHDACITGLGTFTEANAANVMLVLSDGEPTAGPITDTPGILTAVSEANTKKVSISAVAFGYGADEGLMANLASQNNGFFVFIQTDDDAATKLLEFYKNFGIPIASGYSIHIEGAYLTASLVPLKDSPFFNGSEVLLTGLYDTALSINTTILYAIGPEIYYNIATDPSTIYPYVESIWAQHRLSYLLNQVLLEGETDTLKAQIISLALQYGLVVKGYTAIILTTLEEPDETIVTTTTTDGDWYYDPTYTTMTSAVTYTGITSTTDVTSQINTEGRITEESSFQPLFALLSLFVLVILPIRRRKKNQNQKSK